jgi:hypothetical protein
MCVCARVCVDVYVCARSCLDLSLASFSCPNVCRTKECFPQESSRDVRMQAQNRKSARAHANCADYAQAAPWLERRRRGSNMDGGMEEGMLDGWMDG